MERPSTPAELSVVAKQHGRVHLCNNFIDLMGFLKQEKSHLGMCRFRLFLLLQIVGKYACLIFAFALCFLHFIHIILLNVKLNQGRLQEVKPQYTGDIG